MNALVLSGFLMGLFGGAHCVGMCGGIVSVVCGGASRCAPADGGAASSRWHFVALYNAGRIASYAMAGALLGAFGGTALADARLDVFRYLLRALAAFTMLAAGLHLLGLPTVFGAKLGASLWRRVRPLATRLLPSDRPRDALLLGLLWALMPCGLLYGALALAASARSAGEGALTAVAFGVGTLPVMLTMSALARTVARWLARRAVRQVAGAVVFGFGVFAAFGLARQVGIGAPFGGGPRHCCPGHAVSSEPGRR